MAMMENNIVKPFMVRYIFAYAKTLITNGLIISTILTSFPSLQATIYGSNLTPSRPATVSFSAAGTDNTILGFAALTNGFSLADYTTQCTYNDFFPISGTVNFAGGTVYLLEDLRFTNTLYFSNISGSIVAGNRSIVFPTTGTDFLLPSSGTVGGRLTVSDITIVFNTNAKLYMPLYIKGNCKIDGRGKRLSLQTGSEIVVRPGGSLILENVEIGRLGNSNIRCLTNNGSITWRRSQGNLTSNYTFSQGSLLFDDTVVLTGTNAFIYTSGLTSTIGTQSTLYVGPGATFQYNPGLARQNLLYMADVTSVLYLDGATLYSTRTGLQLSGGTLMCDDNVTLSSDALYPAEGMSLKSSLAITARGESNINIYGIVRAD